MIKALGGTGLGRKISDLKGSSLSQLAFRHPSPLLRRASTSTFTKTVGAIRRVVWLRDLFMNGVFSASNGPAKGSFGV